MDSWLCITNEENWEVIKKKGIWGVPEKEKIKVKWIKEGDKLIFYVKPHKIVGIFEVTSKLFKAFEKIFKDKAYPYRIKIKPVFIPKKPLDIRTIVGKLIFITNKTHWGAYLQGRAMRSISKSDYLLIKQRLKIKKINVDFNADFLPFEKIKAAR